MKQGSITVFMSMTLMMLMSLFFTLAEGVHYKILANQSLVLANQTTESMMAMYQQILWENYGILGVDMGFGIDTDDTYRFQNKADSYLQGNANSEGVDFLRFQEASVDISSYLLLTDQDAAPYIQEAVDQVKYQVTEDLIADWTSQFQLFSEDAAQSEDVDTLLDEGKDATEKVQSSEDTVAVTTSATKATTGFQLLDTKKDTVDTEEAPADPFATLEGLMKNGVLSVALPENFEISDAAVDTAEFVSNRELQQGTWTESVDASAVEQLLLEQYFILNYQSAVESKSHAGLAYEMEYILCGNASDRENLEDTIQKIMVLREIENMISITTSKTKMTEVEAYAIAITTATANPLLYEGVKWGLVALWALIESILDVRTLLSGERVAILKTEGDWTSGLLHFSSYIGAGKQAKSSSTGLNYNDYLRILMLAKDKTQLAYRGMDLCENCIRMEEQYGAFQMDHVIVKATLDYEFETTPVFFSFVPVLQGKYSLYHMTQTGAFDYL